MIFLRLKLVGSEIFDAFTGRALHEANRMRLAHPEHT
jgi:hypothetical protein